MVDRFHHLASNYFEKDLIPEITLSPQDLFFKLLLRARESRPDMCLEILTGYRHVIGEEEFTFDESIEARALCNGLRARS